MTTATAQIANHLNVVEAAILEIQEWANVLWVRIAGHRPRFVSKKVIKMEAPTEYKVQQLLQSGGKEWRKGDMHRIYFNDLHTWYGLETSHYNTGNISGATLDGKEISNSRAKKICSEFGYVKLWFDVTEGKFLYTSDKAHGASATMVGHVLTAIKAKAGI